MTSERPLEIEIKTRILATSTLFLAALTLLIALAAGTPAAAQAQLKVLRNFGNGAGVNPFGRLTLDTAGNLYGVSSNAGLDCYFIACGMVFELSPTSRGSWREKIVHNFSQGQNGLHPGGFYPNSGLIFDAAGNLYGTTIASTAPSYCCGTVFELTPSASGSWTETVLLGFNTTGTDAYEPFAGLIFDAAGNLYGTTSEGGAYAGGTVFELTPTTSGGWSETVLHNFNGTDGARPLSGLVLDAAGNLYGTTSAGGAYSNGTVFELTPGVGGPWTQTVLYSFNNGDAVGANNQSGVILDPVGNLYGTASGGLGTVFELVKDEGWAPKVLFNFNSQSGFFPFGLIFDAAGNLYGTTGGGGSANYGGTVYELSPRPGGAWSIKVLVAFSGVNQFTADGPVLRDASGNLYGTTYGGGIYDAGTVYEVIPQPVPTTTTKLVSSLNPSIYGQTVTWSATVTTSSGSTVPTGRVKFTWSVFTIGSATLDSSGVATFTRSNLSADSYPLTAVYLGDANNPGSTSAVLNQVVTEATTSATLTSSPNPSTPAQAVTFTATISSPTVAANGPVTFTAGKTVLGTAQLSGGKAKFTTSTLTVGSTTVTATYQGDSNIAGSSASVTQTVQP
jgi:uncharacterized repeat protein (TIGR03803 family)